MTGSNRRTSTAVEAGIYSSKSPSVGSREAGSNAAPSTAIGAGIKHRKRPLSCVAKRPNVRGCGQACLSCGKADSTSAVEEQIPLSRGGVIEKDTPAAWSPRRVPFADCGEAGGDLTELARFVRPPMWADT